jgi:16S rRNA (cytidine1402-2'-O)-methyltransferase
MDQVVPTVYMVATPIGNLSDITLRAIETLKSVDVIVCEDTRHTKRLLDHFQISKPLSSIHQHSTEKAMQSILGKYALIAYVTDAGTPGISDPGGKLVAAAVAAGVKVVPIPGPSAIIAALSISGLPTDSFLFLGFMPHKGKTRHFKQIAESVATSCFYESTHRIMKTLAQLKEVIGADRQVVVARELTKTFETVYRGTLDQVLAALEPQHKGEFVVMVAGKKTISHGV